MRLFLFSIVGTVLFSIQAIYGQEKLTIAVLELDAAGFSKVEAKVFTERLRTELFRTGRYTVLERERMNDILTEQGFQLSGCVSNECVVEAGKLIGVKHMVAGSLARIGQLITINIRMIDVETGKVLTVATDDCECEIEEFLVSGLERAASILAGSNIKLMEQKQPETIEERKKISPSSDRQLLFAKALYNNRRYDEAQASFQEYLDQTENKDGIFNALKIILELSQTKEDFIRLVPQKDGDLNSKHELYVQRCDWLMQNYSEYKDQIAEEIVLVYYKKLKEWEENELSQDLLIGLIYKDIVDDITIEAIKLVDWNRNSETQKALNQLANKDLRDELLAEVLYQKIINRLPGFENTIIYFETLFPNHEYLYKMQAKYMLVDINSEKILLSKKDNDKIYLSGLEKIEIFINGENILQKYKPDSGPILLKEKQMELVAYYLIEPNKEYKIIIKTFNYGDDWVLFENRSDNIIVKQKDVTLKAPQKNEEKGSYKLRVKIDKKGMVIDCSLRFI